MTFQLTDEQMMTIVDKVASELKIKRMMRCNYDDLVFEKGDHKGETYAYVYENYPEYTCWARNVKKSFCGASVYPAFRHYCDLRDSLPNCVKRDGFIYRIDV